VPQYFIDKNQISSGICRVSGPDFHHLINVRRVKEGALIDLRSSDGGLIKARVVSIAEDFLSAETVSAGPSLELEPRPEIVLVMALIKGAGMDLVVRKAVEAGVSGIVPVHCERSIVDLKERGSARVQRWRRIAAEASKQCMREKIPPVDDIIEFHEAVKTVAGTGIFADPSSGLRLSEVPIPPEKKGAVIIGPEGGFSHREALLAGEAGWHAVSFGSNILKAETAGIVIPAITIYEWSR
jgi:16S rRNA (uracil1498-N3)-methyltransferase